MKPLIAVCTTLLLLAPLGHGASANALWSGGVQALLDENCVKCHGPLKQKSGLVLDTVDGALKGNEDGPVIKPGKPEESTLMDALKADADPHMPPKKQLSTDEIEKVRTWILKLGDPEANKPKDVDAEVAGLEPSAAIDRLLEDGWQDRGVTPAPLCDDRTFVRRIYLDLAGRIPKQDEVAAFLSDSSSQKREALVDHLLASDEYPRTFRETWDALLMGRTNGRREQRRRENGWFAFLENAFKENRPWNEVVRAMIMARPDKPEDKGAVVFLYDRRNDYQQMAEALAPIIYGTRVSCAQCHDHPLAREIKQGHYWGLVAAFNRSKNVEKGALAINESAVGGFINFTNLKKESQPAVMAMLTGRTIEESRPEPDAKEEDKPESYVDSGGSVKVPKFSRRGALADAATNDNPLLAKSFVNYTWAILMGRGIVHPVDEINSKHPASHPELLDWLAKDFASHHYDMRRVVRSIVLSRGYQLSTPAPGTTAPPPEAFAAAAEKPLIAEALARSAEIASGHASEDSTVRQAFADAFPDVLPRVPRASIQQAMLLANNDHLSGLFKPEPDTAAERLAALPSVEERVREAFRSTLIREPDDSEVAQAAEYLNAHAEHPGEAAGQLLWALVTSPEFLTNH